jgi:fatty-acid desaturase
VNQIQSQTLAKEPLAWGIIIWMTIAHALAFTALFYFSWFNFALFFGLYFLTSCIGITFSYHRMLSHRAFKAPRWLERLGATFGVLSLEGGPVTWVAHHRMHHAFTDTAKDPHDSNRGFWFSHMGWMMLSRPQFDNAAQLQKFARDIQKDPYMRFLENPFVQIGMQVALGLTLWATIGFGTMLWAVFLRVVCVYHATWFVNSACHMWGYRRFKTPELSRNNWFVAVLTWGEGWHNNHHAHQQLAPSGHRFWEIDVTYYIIRTLEALGITWDVNKLSSIRGQGEGRADAHVTSDVTAPVSVVPGMASPNRE